MKKIFTLLIAACSALLVALIPTAKASAAEGEGLRTQPTKEELSASSFELGGIKYTKGESSYTASVVDNTTAVETVVLRGANGNMTVEYPDDFTLEGYENVEEVIVMNHYFDNTIEYLATVPQAFDLYVAGRLGFNNGFEDINVRHLYICTPYAVNTDMMLSSYMLEYAQGSPIYSFNYLSYVPNFSDAVSEYNSSDKITNVDGMVLELNKIEEKDFK